LESTPEPLSYMKQLEKLQSRGMTFDNWEFAESMIQQIGYYRIKEAAYPLAKVVNKELIYDGIRFRDVITRYLQDKNLRVYLLHSIEEIEVSIKTKFSNTLGFHGPFTYLDFSSWCNREEYCKHYLNDQQKNFIYRLKAKMRTSNSRDIRDKRNLNEKNLPTVWLATDILTFGDILHLLELMSNNNLKRIADCYDCTPKEFISWIKCLKFVRNICAHNANIIDIKLNTTPTIIEEWRPLLFQFSDGKYTDRIAVILCIINRMMLKVNPNYNFNKIYSPVSTIISRDNNIAKTLGFKGHNCLSELFPKSPKITNRPHKKGFIK